MTTSATLAAVVREVFTEDAMGGTRIELRHEWDPPMLALWDPPLTSRSHHTFYSIADLSLTDETQSLVEALEQHIKAALRMHREPYNRLLGEDLPDVSEADYFA